MYCYKSWSCLFVFHFLWFMVYGLWRMVYGLRCMVYGAWHGVWSMGRRDGLGGSHGWLEWLGGLLGRDQLPRRSTCVFFGCQQHAGSVQSSPKELREWRDRENEKTRYRENDDDQKIKHQKNKAASSSSRGAYRRKLRNTQTTTYSDCNISPRPGVRSVFSDRTFQNRNEVSTTTITLKQY